MCVRGAGGPRVKEYGFGRLLVSLVVVARKGSLCAASVVRNESEWSESPQPPERRAESGCVALSLLRR